MAAGPLLGAEFSLATLLAPLPATAFGDVARVLSAAPSALAVPFVKTLAERNHGVELADNTVTNVLWKLGHYGGIGRGVDYDFNNPRLKDLQKLAPSAPTIQVHSNHGVCPRCRRAELQRCSPKTSSRVPFNIKRRNGVGMILETRCRVYTMGAGIQNASFSEEYCPKCSLCFLGQWQCEKRDRSSGRGTYGRMTNIKLVAGISPLKYFVVPRDRAWYAVDAKLLQFLADELRRGGGTFNSAVLAWSEQRAEIAQRGLIPGEDLALLRANGVRLEDAWYGRHAVRLAGCAASDVKWSFTRCGLESTLLALAHAVRRAHLQRAVDRARGCPKCAGELLVLLDEKYGARRFICGGLDGYESMGTLQMELYTGCLQNAPAGRFFCAQCQTRRVGQNNLTPQTQILGVAPAESREGSSLKYLVRCSDPGNPSESFDAFLPRAEVPPELLAAYEKSLLPAHGDHGSQKARPAWLKGHRQVTRWLKGQMQACQGGARSDASAAPRARGAGAGAAGRAGAAPGGAAAAVAPPRRRPAPADQEPQRPGKRAATAPRRAGRVGPAAARSTAAQTASSSAGGGDNAAGASAATARSRRPGAAGLPGKRAAPAPKRAGRVGPAAARPTAAQTASSSAGGGGDAAGTKRKQCRGWLALNAQEEQSILACGVDKLQDSDKIRRCTGGIMTAVTSCGWLMDWMELTRGESIEVVYAFALRLHKDAQDLGCVIGWLGYDNACKLLSMARVKKDDCLPWTKSLAEEVRIVLDGFHRDNHTWCLNALPEVDPLQPVNAKFLESKNTEACEQLNAWISPRTRVCLEMTRAHFQLHW
ncbi:unnamed protein product, partial [Prorocentrum cordatum]